MYLTYVLRSFLIGFSIAATIGPVAVLCIQRTFQRGFVYGLIAGFGIATADSFYAGLASFGLTVLVPFLMQIQFWIRLAGCCFLLYLGVRTFLSPPAQRAATVSAKARTLLGAYFSLFFFTLANPLTILMFTAIFAGMGVGATEKSFWVTWLMVGAVFLGSLSWWFILTTAISLFRQRITNPWLVWVNRLSGCVIFLFGVVFLFSLFF